MLELFAVIGLVLVSASLALGLTFNYLPHPIQEVLRGISKGICCD